jgi:pycsar effector protein
MSSSKPTKPPAKEQARAIPEGCSELPEFARHIHSYLSENIQFADQKAGFIFAASGAVLAYEFQKNVHLLWLKSPRSWSWLDGFACVSMLSLLVAGGMAAAVVLPRLKKSYRGLVFFGSIADYGETTRFATAVMQRNNDQLSQDLLSHSYDLAVICRTKYGILGCALWAGAVGFVTGVLVLLGQ